MIMAAKRWTNGVTTEVRIIMSQTVGELSDDRGADPRDERCGGCYLMII